MTLSNVPGPAVPAPTQNSQLPASAQAAAAVGDFPIPAYSRWFSFATIHDIERRAFPEFFGGDNGNGNDGTKQPDDKDSTSNNETTNPFRTPQAYQEYRDFMIHSFRMRPSEYLSVTVCRRHLAGDVTMIMKIHAFLEQWGLINYQVTESSTSAAARPVGSEFVASTIHAHKSNLPASLDAFLKSEEGASQLKCRACEADCTALYYHSPVGKMNLCPGCYASGSYGTDLAAGDFIKIDTSAFTTTTATVTATSTSGLSSSDWTEEETLKLLEAVEKYSDSGVNMAANNVWDAIAENVGRSREACLLQFLRLPIVEMLNNSSSNSSNKGGEPVAATTTTALPAAFTAFPFSQSENPVLSVVAFLAANVHPRVAAVASQAALAELSSLQGEGGDQDQEKQLQDTAVMQQVASVALASAAAHAQELAVAEEKRLQYWRECLLETQLKKLQLKLDSLDELERIVEEDRKAVAEQRLQIFMERYNLRKLMIQYERASSSKELQ